MTKARNPVKTCVICGSTYVAHNRAKTCSPECSLQLTKNILRAVGERKKSERRAAKQGALGTILKEPRRRAPVQGVCDKRTCKGCRYYRPILAGYGYICHYILDTGHMRPCPAGIGCIAKRK